MELLVRPLTGKHKEFTDKLVYNIKDRLKEVYGETLPRELDEDCIFELRKFYSSVFPTCLA